MSKQVVATRRDFEIPIKLTFEPDRTTGRLRMPVNELSITGQTKDLSHTGIAFIVAAVRLKEYYLVGEGRTLNAELDLPDETIRMQIVGQRYQQVGEHSSVASYLIGASILQMTEADRETYEYFLRYGRKRRKRRKAGSLRLGIDES